MTRIIQFPHPGSEHNEKTGSAWNKGSHKRKYIKFKGSYLDDLLSEPINNDIYFWGEWEAQSQCIQIERNKSPLPKYIFEPYYQTKSAKTNTDPFVFGNQFYYCICKQGHYPSLRNLKPGDIILFGSNLKSNFVLDTVFVIKDYDEYQIGDIKNLKSKFNSTFYDITLMPLVSSKQVECKEIIADNKGNCLPACGDNKNDDNPTINNSTYRIYRAAMYDDRDQFGGIFSYAPCSPEPTGNKGFARPIINPPYISQGLNQGIKIIDHRTNESVWNEVTSMILSQGLKLMIKTELPLNL